MLEIHAESRESWIVVYDEFLHQYGKSDSIVYGFVEGKDDPSFYRGIIKNQLPDGWNVKLIKAGNKDKVFKVFDKMDWSEKPKNRICFFVDRDLSVFLEEETRSSDNIYTTDNYSIENDAVNFETFEAVLEDVFGLNKFSLEEIDSIRLLFESNLVAFGEAMAPVMAQIVLWRKAGANVSLGNINPEEFFEFERGQIRLKESYILQGNRVGHAATRVDAPMSKDTEIAEAEAEFRRQQGCKKYIRGKYLLWFFIQCAKEIYKAIPCLCRKYQKPPKIHIELGPSNGMMVIGPRVRCPTSPRSFLEHNYGSIFSGCNN